MILIRFIFVLKSPISIDELMLNIRGEKYEPSRIDWSCCSNSGNNNDTLLDLLMRYEARSLDQYTTIVVCKLG